MGCFAQPHLCLRPLARPEPGVHPCRIILLQHCAEHLLRGPEARDQVGSALRWVVGQSTQFSGDRAGAARVLPTPIPADPNFGSPAPTSTCSTARAGHPTTIPVPMTHCQRSSENPGRPSLTIPVHGHGRQADGHERSRQPDSSPEGRLPYRDGSDALVGAAGLRIARSAETLLEAVGPTKEALRRRPPPRPPQRGSGRGVRRSGQLAHITHSIAGRKVQPVTRARNWPLACSSVSLVP
ncbi:hypothetical protein H4W80_002501 [Nonomuraea angiospora]|uniref:Uncharacterized protein n=1 Tax=Nonomuraea angiospora TaxID=46172 RepID=A0ABR9LUA5_9ACTN|nr:hypothetical protein [Nonomuraea angiospora]